MNRHHLESKSHPKKCLKYEFRDYIISKLKQIKKLRDIARKNLDKINLISLVKFLHSKVNVL